MAEFLIKAKDNSNPNPDKDKSCYKKGDLVVAMPDDHEWGAKERDTARFLIVQIPDMSLDEARSLIMEDKDNDGKFISRRRYHAIESGVKAENIDKFNESIAQKKPYKTNRIDFISLALEDKKA